jgi:hypothetical protein
MSRRSPVALVVCVPGLWEHAITAEMASWRKDLTDPRVFFMADDPAARQRLNDTSPVVRQARRRLAELEAAYAARESIVVRCSDLRCRQFPEAAEVPSVADPWSGVQEVRITADDHVEPAQVHRNGGPRGH